VPTSKATAHARAGRCARICDMRGPGAGARADRWLRTVFPEPLRPTMSVRGLGNVITFVFSGEKLRTPLMRSLSTVAMLSLSLSRAHIDETHRGSSEAFGQVGSVADAALQHLHLLALAELRLTACVREVSDAS